VLRKRPWIVLQPTGEHRLATQQTACGQNIQRRIEPDVVRTRLRGGRAAVRQGLRGFHLWHPPIERSPSPSRQRQVLRKRHQKDGIAQRNLVFA
jgi:hypothetical protein